MNDKGFLLALVGDLATCFMGILLALTTVMRPPVALRETQETLNAREVQIQALQHKLTALELELTRTRHASTIPPEGRRTEIFVQPGTITVKAAQGAVHRFESPEAFSQFLRTTPMPSYVLLYCHREIPFEQVARVIDILKGTSHPPQIAIAALNQL